MVKLSIKLIIGSILKQGKFIKDLTKKTRK